MGFTDKFSPLAKSYAVQRPRYPACLFEWLASLTWAHELAWDCATGNGQAAIALASYYKSIIATDASASMIESAETHERVKYLTAGAESVPAIEGGTADLVTVAQAVHWFDLEKFYAEVKRVLKPGGSIALWSYAGSHVTDEIDKITKRLNRQILRGYWAPNVEMVNRGYRNLPFPFTEVKAPKFLMEVDWTLAEFLDYHRTWSAAGDYFKDTGKDAVALVADELGRAWGEPSVARTVSWRLNLRVGRYL